MPHMKTIKKDEIICNTYKETKYTLTQSPGNKL